jgi:hypothetical protein
VAEGVVWLLPRLAFLRMKRRECVFWRSVDASGGASVKTGRHLGERRVVDMSG